jgi:hypothetical protein
MYTKLKLLALQGAPYIYEISRLRVKSLRATLPAEIFTGILIFKGITARRLYKSLGVKGLIA